MKEALKNLSKIIGEFGDRIQEAITDFEKSELPVVWAEQTKPGGCYTVNCPYDCGRGAIIINKAEIKRAMETGVSDSCYCGKSYIIRIREELPVVWVERIPPGGYPVGACPHCDHRYDSALFASSVGAAKEEKGYKLKCTRCVKDYIIRIRPDDPVEEFKEGWEGFAVYQDENYCIKPSIFKASIRTHGLNRAIYLDRNDLENRERAITLKDYLKGGFALDYISLHRTYAEALTVAAGLWEKEGTELSYVFFSRRDEKYILREFRFRDSKAEYNDSVEGWTRDRNEYLTDICAYIGPDRELAEKICAEKNAEMKPEVDDSVLDKVITTSELVSMTEAYPLSPMMVWIWGITDPTWDELLGRKPAWAQWVVDNLAGDIDAKVLEALKGRLK